MITIAVANQKGGVGKTTISFNLAQILSRKKRTSVLAVDNAPQGNLTASFLENTEDLAGNISDAYDGKPLRPIKISNSLYVLGPDIQSIYQTEINRSFGVFQVTIRRFDL